MASVDHFDDWAITYDEALDVPTEAFPFAGYDSVLDALVDAVRRSGATRVLDLGIGTGTLAQRLVATIPDLEVWGIDFSPRMLEQARRKVPSAFLVEADLHHGLANLALPCFGAAVSSYVLQEFSDDQKAVLIDELLRQRLEPGGLVAVGDIAFPDADRLAATRQAVGQRWDDTEHYVVADAFLHHLREQGIDGTFRPLSPWAGVFTFHLLRADRPVIGPHSSPSM